MKVIFLDIDGVLNVYPQGHDEFGAVFHSHFEDNLRKIIDKTGAKIVISSTWRYSGLEVMQEMWVKRDLPGDVIDITPSHRDMNRNLPFMERLERGSEIQTWLDDHPEVTTYVILDDDTDMLETQLNNFIKTSENTNHSDYIDHGYGLTKECTQKAIEILNRNR
jgi:hypothetical protein